MPPYNIFVYQGGSSFSPAIINSGGRYPEAALKKIIKNICILNEYKLDYQDVKFSIDINPSTIL